MQIITEKINLSQLKEMSKKMYDNFVKAVVDIEKEIMAVDADMHTNLQELLLQHGSEQDNLWGITIYPNADRLYWIEFASTINVRPFCGNNSRSVENVDIQKKINAIVNALVIE